MAILINGVAGFIGTNLANRLLLMGEKVFGIDNLSRGSLKNIEGCFSSKNFHFNKIDLSNEHDFSNCIEDLISVEEITEVWHLAANSDILAGITTPDIDLRDTFLTTYNTLRIMEKFNIRNILFASTSAIYGDMGSNAIKENSGPLFPISNYGAMKLASESIISAASETFIDNAYIFRFPNVVGCPATHGILLDLIKKLRLSPNELHVLGDGTQQKAYLHISELIDAMLFIRDRTNEKLNYYNIGADDTGVSVSFIANKVVEMLSPNAKIIYGLTNKGWVGDVPRFTYNIDKVKSLGWWPKLSSEQAILKALNEIIVQES